MWGEVGCVELKAEPWTSPAVLRWWWIPSRCFMKPIGRELGGHGSQLDPRSWWQQLCWGSRWQRYRVCGYSQKLGLETSQTWFWREWRPFLPPLSVGRAVSKEESEDACDFNITCRHHCPHCCPRRREVSLSSVGSVCAAHGPKYKARRPWALAEVWPRSSRGGGGPMDSSARACSREGKGPWILLQNRDEFSLQWFFFFFFNKENISWMFTGLVTLFDVSYLYMLFFFLSNHVWAAC